MTAIFGYQLMWRNNLPFYFSDPIEDLSYGWYVPFFSLYVLWVERRKIRESLGEPSPAGMLFALPFLFIGFIGARGGQVRFELIGFVGTLLAIAWTFFGRRTAKAVFFPCVFLLFCTPIQSYLNGLTVALRMFAVSVSHSVLSGCGLDLVRQGTMLSSADGAFGIDIAAPCSGLRSLFAMLALTAGYAYFNQPTWLRRGLLVGLSVPLAIFGNVIRVLTIAFIATTCNADFATGFYHDYSGYIVFLVAISLMLAVSGFINWGAEKCCAK